MEEGLATGAPLLERIHFVRYCMSRLFEIQSGPASLASCLIRVLGCGTAVGPPTTEVTPDHEVPIRVHTRLPDFRLSSYKIMSRGKKTPCTLQSLSIILIVTGSQPLAHQDLSTTDSVMEGPLSMCNSAHRQRHLPI